MFFVFKKKNVALGAVALVVLVVLAVLTFSEAILPSYASTKRLPIYSVETSENKVALTFDASWGAEKTSKIMDIFEEQGFKGQATFFLVGFWVDKYPEKVKELHERGFLIGNHSTNHLHMGKMNERQIEREINQTQTKIKELVGYAPAFFRAPFGEYSNRLVDFNVNNNLQIIQWDVDSLDWKGLSGGEIAGRVLSKVQSGSIILCHNDAENILDALPLILIGLKNRGLTPVRLNELVMREGYRVDSSGRQVKAASNL